jgi:hypothetical protein
MEAPRRQKELAIIIPIVVLGTIGVLAIGVGIFDALTAPRLQYQLVGGMFTIAGLTMLSACACLAYSAWRSKAGRLAAVCGGTAGSVLSLYLLAAQAKAPGSLNLVRLAAWLIVGLVSVSAILVAWWSTRPCAADQIKVGPLLVKLISGVGIASALFTGVQWWYANQYLPGAVGASLSIRTDMREQARPANSATELSQVGDPYANPRVFNATITIENTSNTTVQVVASLYRVLRIPFLPAGPSPQGSDTDVRAYTDCFFEELAPVQNPDEQCLRSRDYEEIHPDDVSGQDDWSVSRYRVVGDTGVEVMELGQAVPDRTFFTPKEKYERTFTVHVPPNVNLIGHELEVFVELIVAKGERLVLAEESHGPEQVPESMESQSEQADNAQSSFRPRPVPHRYEVTAWSVESLGVIPRLTMGSASVNVIRVLTERHQGLVREAPYLALCFSEADRFQGADESDPIRRDPTRVCPGVWDPSDNNEYGLEMAEYSGWCPPTR